MHVFHFAIMVAVATTAAAAAAATTIIISFRVGFIVCT